MCKKYKGISFSIMDDDNIYVDLDSDFCKYSLQTVESFFYKIHKEMKDVNFDLN